MSPKESNGKKEPNSKSYLPFVIIAAVLAAAVVGAWWLLRSPESPAAGANQSSSASSVPKRPPGRPAEGAQPAHSRGNVAAPATLEEFADFECPQCARMHAELKKIGTEYGTQLRVVFRNFPLPSIHRHAIDAARAAEAAGRQNRFWEMHDKLYETQNVWKNDADVRARFAEYAGTLGLNVEQFKSDMDAPAVMERVIADQTRGKSLGVTGTPSLFINGQEVDSNSMTPEQLRKMIDAAIAGTKK